MFKKSYQTKPQSALRVSACRHLVQEAKEKFPQAWPAVDDSASATDSDRPVPMPAKLQTARFVSHVGDKGEIMFSESGEPLWIRAEVGGRDTAQLVPTVYTQWLFPNVLPVLWTWQPVVEKLVGGADLMTAGLVVPENGLPDLPRGALVAVCAPGSLAAQAIGVLALDTRDIHKVVGAKGKAVLVVHTYQDHLWEAGSKTALPEIPVTGSDAAAAVASAAEGEPAVEGVHLEAAGEKSQTEEDAAGLEGEEAETAAAAKVTPAEMDALLMTSLKQAMATTLDESHASALLPIGASTLFSTYMIPNAPNGADLDIKKSSYKKLAKFLKAVEKHGLVKLKDIRGESHIKSLNWKHPDMASYQPFAVKSKQAAGPRAAADSATAPQKQKAEGSMVKLAELLKPPQALRALFSDIGDEPESGYFTRQQARAVLESYIKKHALVDTRNPRNVRLDHHLCDGLLTKDEYSKLTVFPRDRLQQRLQEKMTLFTQLTVPGCAPVVKPGRPPTVDIFCEKKMGNKVVTRAVGLEAYGVDPAAVAKELRTMCASSTTVDPVPGKKGVVAVIVQGHQVKAVTKLLEKHGLAAELLKVSDKSGKSKK